MKNYPVPRLDKKSVPKKVKEGPRGRIRLPFIKEFLQQHSYAYTFLRLRYNSILYKLGVRSSAHPEIVEKGLGVTFALFNSMKSACDEHGCRFCVVMIPSAEQIKGLEPDTLQRKFVAYATERGIDYLNLLDWINGRRDLNYIIDSHWNNRGHEFVANILFKELNKHLLGDFAGHPLKEAALSEL